MAAWVKLATMVVQAEFPDFELVHSLGLFNLEGDDIDADSKKSCLAKLSKTWGIDRKQLEDEFDKWRPVAMHYRRMEGLGLTDAWARALRRTRHAHAALSSVLERMASTRPRI